MKRLLLLAVLVIVILSSCNIIPDAISGATRGYNADGNSFYHRTDETKLKPGELWVEGEVQNPGKVKYKRYLKREVLHKMAVQGDSGKVVFTGAYRYRGYSLFDLLIPLSSTRRMPRSLFLPPTCTLSLKTIRAIASPFRGARYS